jgi:diacylglycerol kinase family enzyme
MKTIALFNPKSGSVPADGRERLQAVLESAGHAHAELVEADPGDPGAQLRELAARGPDLFIVWGGDGTLRAALTEVGAKTSNLLLLPGGTMNLLPRILHGEKSWEDVLRDVIKGPRRKTLPAGEVNGQAFYCAMLAGAPARFAEAREALRRGDLGKAAGEARAAIDVLNTLHLGARYSNGYAFADERLPTSSVIGAVIGALTKTGEGMEVASLANPTTGGALNVVWTSFFTDWRNAPGVEVAPATSLDVESEDGEQIPVIADGEPADADERVHVTFREKAAECLVAA